MRLRQALAAALVLAALAYLALRAPPAGPGDDARFVRQDLLALGTLVSFSLYLDEGVPRERADAALAAAETLLASFETTWSPWGDGELGVVNRALAAGEVARVPPGLVAMFDRADAIRRLSGGTFDARVGALVRTWGFDDEVHFRTEPPGAGTLREQVAALRRAPEAPGPCPGAAAADATQPLCFGPAPGVQWDFGGIAKGVAVDRLAAHLRDAGIHNLIVNAGGNLRVAGRRGDRPWHIGIRKPRAASPADALAVLDAGDEAVITSGDYERYFESGGVRYHHILDPRTGEPARGLQSVTVAHGDGALADAASTALFVAGPSRWRETARALGVEQVMVVDADGEVVVTQALAPRLRFPGGTVPRVVP